MQADAAQGQELQNRAFEQRRLEEAQTRGQPPLGFSGPQFYRAKNAAGKEYPLPIPANAQASISPNFNDNRGTHRHAGIDIAVPVGTKVLSLVGGTVTTVTDHGTGYGQFITVKGDDGKYYRFAHLSKFSVARGQRVEAGTVLGLSGGEPGTKGAGDTSGPHLHFEVRTSDDFGIGAALDPITYLANFPNYFKRARGGNRELVPTVLQRPTPNAVPTGDGGWLSNGQYLKGTSGSYKQQPIAYSNANPMTQEYASTKKKDYRNDGAGNFGYQVIAQDREFRIKLHQISSKLGIPAQWLADLMAFETGGTFDPAKDNGYQDSTDGRGYTGLIQFGQASAEEMNTSRAALAAMTRTQQLDYVYRYLLPVKSKLVDPFAVLMSVWGGRGEYLDMYVKDPELVRYLADKDIKFFQYAQRLGEHAGRKYRTPYMKSRANAVIHTGYVASCSTCQNLQASGSGEVPHYG
jgi:hypothetical protein